ncbi:hypothetical protein J5N97_027132 [Dioscorea zingiberensis]|uniref:Photosystem II repair protein PSB27-H1, chloroplastic n=1 Tax=Dioscorea zingiberensis TaxID=325984 RepID=A0A9D5C4B3_9LILI|nr:hypothetical protein J5N97_027132 [Dioscorea zingiberensis]
MASSSLLTTPTSKKPALPFSPISCCRPTAAASGNAMRAHISRREMGITIASCTVLLVPLTPAARASSDEEYVRETTEVINKVRSTINLEKTDPNVAAAVAELRDASNSWVAKYRREKALLGRASFRDMYSALNAVSGHYISFGPTAPIPAKRKARILEEMDTAEKALLRGR